MSFHIKALAGTALIAALGLGFAQSAPASTLPQTGDSLISQTPVEGETPVQAPAEGVTRVPARVIRVFGNDYAQVELLSTGESRPIEFRYLGDTRRIIPGTYLIIDYEANEVVGTEIVTEDEANQLLVELETTQTAETQVEQQQVEQQPAPTAPPATQPAPTAPPATQQQPAPTQPVPALW
ncbi:hypothetical protein [Egbenema bharatensis]|uniref:hypothetical protein n=1 Tax=Egbenema bharatensis TaxID=3463334 RepID=UPI003A89AF62